MAYFKEVTLDGGEKITISRRIIMAKQHLRLVTPSTENRTVTPRRRPNADLRTREYLTDAEVARLQKRRETPKNAPCTAMATPTHPAAPRLPFDIYVTRRMAAISPLQSGKSRPT